MTASGQLDKWARDIAGAMTGFGDVIANIDWVSIATDIAGIARGIGSVASAIATIGGGGLSGLFNAAIIAVIGKIAVGLYGLATALGVVSIAGAPIWLVVAGIAAVAAGAFLVYRNWDKISGWFSARWNALKTMIADGAEAIVAHFQGMWERAKKAFSEGVSAVWNMLPSWMRKVLNGGTFTLRLLGNLIGGQGLGQAAGNAARDSGIIPRAPASRVLTRSPAQLIQSSTTQRTKQTEVSGLIKVEIDQNGFIRPRLAQSSGPVNMAVGLRRNLAHSMGGPA